MPVRVAYLIDAVYPRMGGTERQLLGWLDRLDRARVEPRLICLHATDWNKTHSLSCPVDVLGYRGFASPSFPSVVLRLRRILKENKVDVLQTFFEDSIFVAWKATRFMPRRPALVASRRDIGMGAGEPWYHAAYKKVFRFVFRDFDWIMANGEKIKEHVVMTAGVPGEKIVVVANGMDVAAVVDPAPDFYKPYAGDFIVGVVANLSPVKRHDVFLEGFARFMNAEGRPPARAVLLGDGERRAALEKQASDLGIADRVHFLGSVKNVAAHLKAWSAGVLCSDLEGFSNAVMEYMRAGLPSVVTDVGGNAELVDGAIGLRFPPGDPQSLAAALGALYGDPALRRRLGGAARARAESTYSWEKSIGALHGFYERAARGAGKV